MKNFFKLALIAFVITYSASLSAQNSEESTAVPLTNKKGIVIMPEKGDYALGIDATPFLHYLGNLLKITDESNYAPTFGFTAQNPGMIYGKYMLTEKKAVNVAFRVGISNSTEKDGSGTLNNQIDKLKESAVNLGVTLGIEKSPLVKSRIRGFWGYYASLGYKPYQGIGHYTSNYVVGNVKYESEADPSRDYEEKGGNTFSIGVGGMIGVEYFVFPKLSLRGQYNLLLQYWTQSERKFKMEGQSEEIIDAGANGFMLDNVSSGSISALFYF